VRCLAEAQQLPKLHVEGFNDAVAGDGFVQDVLNVGELVLPAARGAANIAADAEDRSGGDQAEERQNPRQAPTERDHDDHHEGEREELLQEIRQDRRRCVLDALNVVDERRKQRTGGVFLEESDRPAQDGLVQVVAHVGDHAETGVVRQIGAGVVADAFQQRGGDEGEGDAGPVIVNPVRNEQLGLEVEMPAFAQFAEERSLFGAAGGAGVEDVVEDGTNEQDAECIEQTDAGGQHDGGESLEPITARVVEQAPETLHAARAPCAGNECISLFYRVIRAGPVSESELG
jgi:hypothetical protein